MEKSLQSQFIESQGNPVLLGKWEVFQCVQIPIIKGIVKLNFLNKATGNQGVALKTKKGSIKLSNGIKTKRLNIWHEANLPPNVAHEVECTSGKLMIWNIYRIEHPDGTVTEDEWTGNAGMVLWEEQKNYRRYGCSDSLGQFSPTDLEFEVQWEDKVMVGQVVY